MSFQFEEHLVAPRVLWNGRWHARDAVAAQAGAWAERLSSFAEQPASGSYAVALPHGPEGTALFLAVLTTPAVPVLLSFDPDAWPYAAELRTGMALVLPPSLAELAPEAERRGYRPILLTHGHSDGGQLRARVPGLVFLTSGSTGRPRPAYRTLRALDVNAWTRAQVLALPRGAGLAGGVPLSSGQGIVQLLTAIGLAGAFGWVSRLDHRQVLDTIARPEFDCWWATPHLADALGRCRLDGPAVAPRICLVSSPLAEGVFERFRSRFGVPLRQAYSSTETGAVALDFGPAESVVPGTVGHVLPGVEVRIGERPDAAVGAGEVGLIWVKGPHRMEGYGMPPDVTLEGMRDGFLPTKDLAAMDADGRLTLKGRIDDRVRTRDGRVVDLEVTNAALRSIPGVTAAVVLPLEGAAGLTLAALIECGEAISLDAIRARLVAELPRWSLPRSLVTVPTLPRLANGKPDRVAALALLSGALPA